MRKIIPVIAVALTAILTACAPDYNYVVKKIGHDPETGRHFLVCGPPSGSNDVEVTKSQEQVRKWRVGERCLDFEVEHAPPVPSSVPPSTGVSG